MAHNTDPSHGRPPMPPDAAPGDCRGHDEWKQSFPESSTALAEIARALLALHETSPVSDIAALRELRDKSEGEARALVDVVLGLTERLETAAVAGGFWHWESDQETG